MIEISEQNNQRKCSSEVEARFWKKIDKKEDLISCWNWKAGKQSKGYGSFGVGGGKTELAHRMAYEITFGSIPDGLIVRHKCDNRTCCNPGHLLLGTIADNNRDTVMRGRTARGERNGRAKLKEFQVRAIREQYKNKTSTQTALALAYKVSRSTIANIVKERYWRLPLAG